jgi:hypothetical protein
MLAHFAEAMKPEPRRVADAETRKLRISVACRSQLNQMMTAELHRQSHSLVALREGLVAIIDALRSRSRVSTNNWQL